MLQRIGTIAGRIYLQHYLATHLTIQKHRYACCQVSLLILERFKTVMGTIIS